MRILWVHNIAPCGDHVPNPLRLLDKSVRAAGVHVDTFYTGNLRRPAAVWRAYLALRKLVRDYDIVHAQYGSLCGLLVAAQPARKLLTLRGSDWYGVRKGNLAARAHGTLARLFTRLSIPFYDGIVAMSARMKHEIEQQAGCRQPVAIVTDAVDLERFRPLDQAECRRRLGFGTDDSPWVVFVATHVGNSVKRADLAKDAVRRAQALLPSVRLHVVTGVSHAEIPLWINASDVVLLTSQHEGWPNVIKEALACNVRFVSTNVSDLAVVSARDATCSVVADTADALACALVRSVQSRRRPALRHHVAHLGAADVADRLKTMYWSLLQQESPASAARGQRIEETF